MVPGLVIEGIFCAQGRVRLMTTIEVFASWFVAIPLAAVLVYYLQSGLEGIVSGLVIGYSVGGTCLFFFFLRSNWEQLSKMVMERNASEGLQYLDTDWDDLPPEVQKAASTLGYTKILWESNREPGSTAKSWNDLTETQRTAAGVLGYNKKKWNGENNSDDDAAEYEEYDFDDLPGEVKKAAKLLGFTRSIWDKGGSIPIESKDWTELTEAEQNAASTLGYTPQKWDNESGSGSSSSSSSSESPSATQEKLSMPTVPEDKEASYDDCDYDDLPSDVKRAARLLGYTRSIWDNDGKVPIESKDWDKLTTTQQSAASTLRYTKEKWDNESDGSSSSSSSSEEPEKANANVEVVYDDCEFQKLPKEVKQAAKVLGYTLSIWNKGGSIPIENKNWNDLTTSQRNAASTLGYTKEKWDTESGSSSSTNTSKSPKPLKESEKVAVVSYIDYRFLQLPDRERKAAEILGYSRLIWDNGGSIPLESKKWDFLATTEQRAAVVLGYTKQKWNDHTGRPNLAPSHYNTVSDTNMPWGCGDGMCGGRSFPNDSSSPWDEPSGGASSHNSRSTRSSSSTSKLTLTNFGGFSFLELPPEIQHAALVVGFTKSTWDKNSFVPKKTRTWANLKPKEKAAALSLGCTEEKWEKLLDSL